MKRRAFLNGLLFSPLCDAALAADPVAAMQETPMFADRVKAGTLPPAARRIPEQPLVVTTFAGNDGPGRQGGQLTMLVTGTRDTVLMTIYSYARLIVYDGTFKLKPDILESYESNEGREFTFRLRAGHKWSDGHPFTTEDFRFFWEDIANNAELSPSGPRGRAFGRWQATQSRHHRRTHHQVQLGQAQPLLYRKPGARRSALSVCAGALSEEVPSEVQRCRRDRRARPSAGQQGRSWVQMFRRRLDAMFINDNADMPSLNPWTLATPPPAQRYVFERNPFYHRIDEKGQQLPYADRVIFAVTTTNLIPAKAGLGEADLQARWLKIRDYTFLQNSARSSGVSVRLWEFGSGSQLALFPNLTTNDAEWRKLFRDVRFRRALSMAIDREELNQVVYLGLATPSNNTIMPRSELFKPDYATRWAKHDPQEAGRLLDEIGLTARDANATRLLPDGRSATIVVESQSEATEEADALKLIADQWRRIGIRMLVKLQTFENFWLRTTSGDAMMTAYGGLFSAVPNPDTSPREFAPTMQGGLQWPKWGMYVASKGKQGEPCDLPEARQLLDDVSAWERAADQAGRRRAWEKILQTTADQVFTIGTVNGIRQPIVVGPKIRNVPKEGFYAWDPGGYFGLYQPDTFWVAP